MNADFFQSDSITYYDNEHEYIAIEISLFKDMLYKCIVPGFIAMLVQKAISWPFITSWHIRVTSNERDDASTALFVQPRVQAYITKKSKLCDADHL